jgi:hypothetical protein
MLRTAKLASSASADTSSAVARSRIGSRGRDRLAASAAIATTTQAIGQPSGVSTTTAVSASHARAPTPGLASPSVFGSDAAGGAALGQWNGTNQRSVEFRCAKRCPA